MLVLGTTGVLYSWSALGFVARGLVPFGLFGGGLIMVGAGVRSRAPARRSSAQSRRPDAGLYRPRRARSRRCSSCRLEFQRAASMDADAGDWLHGTRTAVWCCRRHARSRWWLGASVGHDVAVRRTFAFARGATLINNVFINAAAAIRYRKMGFIALPTVAVLLPAALAGVTGGTLLQEGFDETLMRRIFAVFVVVLTFAIVIDSIKVGRQDSKSSTSALATDNEDAAVAHGLTGGLAGLLSGILGISGGVIAVPGQTLFGRVPLRAAIANSTVMTAVSSGLGSLLLLVTPSGAAFSGMEMATIAVLFVPGNLIGGHLGAQWMERLPVGWVRAGFVLALILITIRSWGFVQV